MSFGKVYGFQVRAGAEAIFYPAVTPLEAAL